jgi:hypothetical protein
MNMEHPYTFADRAIAAVVLLILAFMIALAMFH